MEKQVRGVSTLEWFTATKRHRDFWPTTDSLGRLNRALAYQLCGCIECGKGAGEGYGEHIGGEN